MLFQDKECGEVAAIVTFAWEIRFIVTQGESTETARGLESARDCTANAYIS